jgi:hypothetical protein
MESSLKAKWKGKEAGGRWWWWLRSFWTFATEIFVQNIWVANKLHPVMRFCNCARRKIKVGENGRWTWIVDVCSRDVISNSTTSASLCCWQKHAKGWNIEPTNPVRSTPSFEKNTNIMNFVLLFIRVYVTTNAATRRVHTRCVFLMPLMQDPSQRRARNEFTTWLIDPALKN